MFCVDISVGLIMHQVGRTNNNASGSDTEGRPYSVSPRVFRVVAYRLAVLYLMNCLFGIDFEHRHQSNYNLFYLFKHVSQYNGAIPKSDP